MEVPNSIKFKIEKAEEGGYIASAIGYSIFTEADTLDQIERNIKDAVECHFGEENETRVCSLPKCFYTE